jgi:ectoine hydroxylase-related dioxygenase (phytanoyl-CoA dioxygenase family)
VWLALDESDEENGAVRFYRGSHRLGLQHARDHEEVPPRHKYPDWNSELTEIYLRF